MNDVWLPIEQAPKQGRITALIWHGFKYFEVTASWSPATRCWIDIDPESSVGWCEGISKPASYKAGCKTARAA